MTDVNPYEPVPLDIPAGHPLLDADGFSDVAADAPANQPVALDFAAGLRSDGVTADEIGPLAQGVLALAIPSGDQLAAALAVIKASGYSVAEATAAYEQSMAALRNSRRQLDHRCHRCNAPVDRHHQWMRRATDDEAEAWHTAREQHIRAHNDGRAAAEYVSDRSGTVTLAVHGCDEHNLAPEPDEPVDSSPEALGAVNFAAQDAGAALRALLHDADCGGHGACECGDGDA